MSDHANTAGEPTSYLGLAVQDENGQPIGAVSDVLYDDTTQQPEWLVVKPGKLRAEHFVPADGAYTTADGTVVVAVSKQMVQTAPKTRGDHIITHDVEDELRQHYASI
jgi:hypothetical protein